MVFVHVVLPVKPMPTARNKQVVAFLDESLVWVPRLVVAMVRRVW
jgi:hypothetical protein